jgi:hypothetical protein
MRAAAVAEWSTTEARQTAEHLPMVAQAATAAMPLKINHATHFHQPVAVEQLTGTGVFRPVTGETVELLFLGRNRKKNIKRYFLGPQNVVT